MELLVAGAIVLLSFIPGSAEKIQEALPLSPSPSPQIEKNIPTPTPIPNEPKIHTVKSGETLDSIAKKYYDGSEYWTILWNDNDFIKDPRVINAGMQIKIRRSTPEKTEILKEELATLYEKIINPSPTPAPTNSPEPQRDILPAGSFEQVYKDAGSRFGIPWEILYGLHLIETGLRDGPISNGSGPQGPLQFLPGTWAAYGIDGNGDGVADIDNAVDAIHGAANYLSAHGGVEQGLRSYGQVYDKVMSAARQRGYGG
jgi:LysM repeat protein